MTRWMRLICASFLVAGSAVAEDEMPAAEATRGAASATATDAAELETIVVTARKRTEQLQEVPAAATAFDARRLQDENVDGLLDLMRRTPGAMTAYLGTSFSNEIIIRGQGSGRQTNAEVATGLYRNGAFVAGGNIGGRNLGRMDLFDAERVEIFRGPQGGLLGRNAVGGAINAVSTRPRDRFEASVTGRYGDNQRVEAEGIANLPVSDTLALRLGAIGINQNEGFFYNTRYDGYEDDEHFFGARASLLWRPQQRFDSVLTVDFSNEAGPSYAVGNYNPTNGEDPYVSDDGTRSRFHQEELTAVLETNYHFDSATLSGVSLYKARDADTLDDIDGFLNLDAPLFADYYRNSDDDFARFGQEVHLASTGSGPWNWLVGAEYLQLRDDFLDESLGLPAPLGEFNNRSLTRSRDTSWAAFGSLGYAFTDALSAVFDLRYTYDDKELDLVSTLYAPDNTPGETSGHYQRSFANTSPSLSLSYRMSPALAFYGRVATAYRGGGFNNIPDSQSPPRFEVPYDAETTVSFETGAKSEWFQRRLRLNGAVYHSRTDDVLIGDRVAVGPTFINYVRNGGRAEQTGVELDLAASIEPGFIPGRLLLDGSAAWSDGELASGDLEGNPIPYVREWQASLSATYRVPLTARLQLFANESFVGGWGGWQDKPSDRPLDDIRLHDLSLGLEGERWQLKGTVRNASDEFYNPQRTSATAVRASRPRSWLLSVSRSFGG